MKNYIILLITLICFSSCSYEECKKEQKWVESKLNTKYILNKDTLIVIDYSNLRNTFILSNGIEINQKVLK